MLPTPIYESLPVVYMAGGSFALTTLESAVGVTSAAVLSLAGLMIARMRWKYRNGR